MTSTKFKVIWEKLNADNSNGVIINYEVCYQAGCAVVDCSQSKKVADVNTADLTGLKPAKTYTVAVRAFTVDGPGPLGESKSKNTLKIGKL